MAQNSAISPRPRGVGRPFSKGESGNPGGRPKDSGPLREMAREHTAEALDVLVQAMRDDDPRIRVVAATAILDRGHGKPTTPIEVEAPVDAEPVSMLELARRIAFALNLGMLEKAKADAAGGTGK